MAASAEGLETMDLLQSIMRTRIRNLLAVVLLAVATWTAAAADVWYEDNNLGTAGGMPPDFVSKFERPETFAQATRHIRVYMVRANVLAQMDDHFLATRFIPYLKSNGIRLAIDAGGATWMRASGRDKVVAMEREVLERLAGLGARVDYVSLQSVLSKPFRPGGKAADYPLVWRIEDAVTYAKSVRDIHPAAAIGVIDALPSHGRDYRKPYLMLRDALAAQGLRLSYIHLDMPVEIVMEQRRGITWQTVKAVERYVEDELGVGFGLFATTSKGGRTSGKAFHQGVMAALECHVGANGAPRAFIIASWFAHPQRTVPETAVGDEYPAMRTVLAFGRRLEQLVGADRPAAMAGGRDPRWRAMCVAG